MTDLNQQENGTIQDQFNELLDQNNVDHKLNEDSEDLPNELAKLRNHNRTLLDESKKHKDKVREIQALYDRQLSELDRLKNIENELNNFKCDSHWNYFLNDLKIDPKYRKYVSSELSQLGYKVAIDQDNNLCIMDHNRKEVDLKHFDGFKKENEQYFLPFINLSSGSGYWGDEPTTIERMKIKANQCIEASQYWLKKAEHLEIAEKVIRDNPTPSPNSLNFGIK